MPDSYDAIVVGAGPAGSTAAYVMAKNHLSVALLERGAYPGSKTVFGGTVYRLPIEQIIPAFWQEAPLERPVVSDTLWIMDNDSTVSMGFTGLRFAQEPYNKFTAQRSLFDRWFAEKAAEQGADVRTSTLVDNLLYDQKGTGRNNKRRVRGVILDTGEQLQADVVVLAEGVDAVLTRKAGLRSDLPNYAVTFYVVEVLSLSSEKIEDRFQLERGEGAVIGMVGFPTAGAVGKGSLFTYKEHVSLMVGGYLNQLAERSLSPYELLQRTKSHPMVRRLLAGAEPVQYKARLVPKGGYALIPRLYRDGLLVVGDAAGIVSGRRGTDLASLTGLYAAETVIQAKAKGDFSASMMANYKHKLKNTFFMEDIKASKDGLSYYKRHPDSDYLIASLSNKMAYEFFTVDMNTKKQKAQKLKKIVQDKQIPLKTLQDLYTGVQHWEVF